MLGFCYTFFARVGLVPQQKKRPATTTQQKKKKHRSSRYDIIYCLYPYQTYLTYYLPLYLQKSERGYLGQSSRHRFRHVGSHHGTNNADQLSPRPEHETKRNETTQHIFTHHSQNPPGAPPRPTIVATERTAQTTCQPRRSRGSPSAKTRHGCLVRTCERVCVEGASCR